MWRNAHLSDDSGGIYQILSGDLCWWGRGALTYQIPAWGTHSDRLVRSQLWNPLRFLNAAVQYALQTADKVLPNLLTASTVSQQVPVWPDKVSGPQPRAPDCSSDSIVESDSSSVLITLCPFHSLGDSNYFWQENKYPRGCQ